MNALTGGVDLRAYEYQEVFGNLLGMNGDNILVVAPTGAGKTNTAKDAFTQYGGGVLVEPTRALCYEKWAEMRNAFPEWAIEIGNKDWSLGVGRFQKAHVTILTPYKLNQFLAIEGLVKAVPVLVIDEIHNMSDEVQFIITKLLVHHPKIRVVGLSATIHEDDRPKFASWLHALTVESDIRPVPLVERVVTFDPDFTDEVKEITRMKVLRGGNKVYGKTLQNPVTGSYDAVLETVRLIRTSPMTQEDKAPIQIFTPYRKRAERLAWRLLKLHEELGATEDMELKKVTDRLAADASDYTKVLKAVLPFGIGIHHGGLSTIERDLVQDLAASGKISVLIACHTLAQGVNLPMKHVVFESVYDFAGDGTQNKQLISVNLFRQIAGRAGRPQFDNVGYVWIPCLTAIEQAEIEEVLLKNKASRIKSSVFGNYFLTAQLPGLVLMGYDTPEELADFMSRTYFGQTLRDLSPLQQQFESIIIELVENGVLTISGQKLSLTQKGQWIAQLGVHYAEAEVIHRLWCAQNLEYIDWVSGLAEVLATQVLNRDATDEVQRIEAIQEVVDFGLSVYTRGANWRAYDLADQVNRLLDIAWVFVNMDVCDVASEATEQWRQGVWNHFSYGNLDFIHQVAGVLSRSEIKRLIRNMGKALAQPVFGQSEATAIVKLLWGRSRELPLTTIQVGLGGTMCLCGGQKSKTEWLCSECWPATVAEQAYQVQHLLSVKAGAKSLVLNEKAAAVASALGWEDEAFIALLKEVISNAK